jgi:Mrp family chromosome partitioning ATPase
VVGAQQIKPAKAATTVMLSPKPRKNAIFGFVIGVVLAAIAAYVMSRFDRRLRTLSEIEAAFQSQILASLPRVKRPIVQREGQPTPSRFLLEPLRRLHTALQLSPISEPEGETPHRIILFVSADPGDGKSTLVADLALVQREAGQRVAVVEANFRHPVQAGLLGLDGTHGLAQVLAGTLPAQEAMQRVWPIQPAPLPQPPASPAGVATAVESRGAGSLSLLAGGGAVANPPALLAQPAMAELLRTVAEDFDYVLLDAPSPLEVSDVMPLLKLVDGILIVARAGHTRETSAGRLLQLLSQAGAPVLGAVANCVPRKEIERSGFSASNGRVWSSRLIGR